MTIEPEQVVWIVAVVVAGISYLKGRSAAVALAGITAEYKKLKVEINKLKKEIED